MANTVRFRFQSEISYRTVKFNEYFISVGELRCIIAERTGLQPSELVLTDNDAPGGGVLMDDGAAISRNATLTVRRCANGSSSAAVASAAAAARLVEMRQEERRLLELATTNHMMRGKKRSFGQRVCHNCKQAGHNFYDCPLQSNKRIKAPSGVPSTKIQRNPDGSLYLPDGTLGEVTTNTKAFAQLAKILGDPSSDDELTHVETRSEINEEIPTPSHNAGITKEQVMAMLPELHDVIATGMTEEDVLCAYGSGRPLSFAEWEALRANAIAKHKST